ncbi:MAG: ATP-binding protein [Candidatus Aenigmatarchaeota archaeon]|jgi:uncharacterized protein (TIGR00269 family)
MRCIACKKKAVINIIAPFCEEHFIKNYENRIRKTINRFKLIEKNDRVLVAISGGKDSMALSYFLSKLRNEIDFVLEALFINIPFCMKEENLKIVKEFCNKNNINLHVVTFEDYGIDFKKLFKLRRPICSTCGMIKRYIMNKFARENGFNKLATGHCSNDISLFFLKNLISQKFEWNAKLKPLIPSTHPKLISKIRPLFEVSEEENELYCKLNKIEFSSFCSYAKIEALRKDKIKKILNESKKIIPDISIKISKSLEKININYQENIRECKICGEPTSGEICGVCKLKQKISNID